MDEPTKALAEWVSSLTYADLGEQGQAMTRRSVLDWVGCAVLGADHPAAELAGQYVQAEGGRGRARVIASTLTTGAANAAWVEAVMGHVHDYDDSGAHPSSYLTPTVLALGDETGCPGTEVLTAWAAGFEVSSRLASGLQPDRSWHTTPLFGTLGACAAAGRLLSLDPAQLRMAFGIAASSAGGLMANFGTMTKALHPANAARAAITAARLAAAGYTANPSVLETQYGYLDCFGGPGASAQAVTSGLAGPALVALAPPAIKAWPTCSSNHATLTALENLCSGRQISAADIMVVDHYGARPPGTGSLRFTSATDPLQAKFCLEYNIAAALVDGQVTLNSFSEERFARGDLQRFMSRIRRHVAESDEHLVLTMVDGTRHDIALPRRRTLSGPEVGAKFRSNLDRAGHPIDASAVAEEIEALADRPSVRRLLDLLTAAWR